MTPSAVSRIQDEMLLGEAGVRLGRALGRFLKGQGCVPVDQQEEEICGWRSSTRQGCWKDRGGDKAGGYT